MVSLIDNRSCFIPGAFYKIRPEAGQLMLPYVAWLVLANLLNIAVWRRNPHANDVERVDASQQKPLENGDNYGPTGPAGKPVNGVTAYHSLRHPSTCILHSSLCISSCDIAAEASFGHLNCLS